MKARTGIATLAALCMMRADVDLALSTIGGESGQCILAGSTVRAFTYPNG